MRISYWSSDVCSSDLLWHPRFWPYARLLDADYLVCHIHDAWDAKAWPAHLQRHHRELVERADLIITTADNMSRELPGIGPGGALVLPMGSISTPSRPVRGNPVRPTSRQFRTRASATPDG